MTRPSFNRHIFNKTAIGEPVASAPGKKLGNSLLNGRAIVKPQKAGAADRRSHARRHYSVPVAVSYFSGEFLFDTWTLNHSLGGLCFSSRHRVEPGATLYIKVKKFHPSGPCTGICEGLRSITLARVVWSGKVRRAGIISYQYGVRYFESAY